MDETLIALLIFLALVGASLGALLLHPRMHAHHLQDDTNNVVRLVANLFVVMTSLVLGLMINSAKNTFEAVDHNVHLYATELILLDRTLRAYGSDADDVRRHLVAYVQHVWDTRDDAPGPDQPLVASKTSERLLTDIGDGMNALAPPDAGHVTLRQDAQQIFRKLIELRWTLVEQSEGTIPMPLLAMLAAWLVLIFASFGYRAPRNLVIVSSMVLAAALIAGSIYLILDMDIPFQGPIRVSPVPMHRALAELQA